MGPSSSSAPAPNPNSTSISRRLTPLAGLGALALAVIWFNSRMLLPIQNRRTDTTEAIIANAAAASGGISFRRSQQKNQSTANATAVATKEEEKEITYDEDNNTNINIHRLSPTIEEEEKKPSSSTPLHDDNNAEVGGGGGERGPNNVATNNDNNSNNNNTAEPKLVWLMSFPNSGTSYTMGNVQKTSQMTVATNYDQEIINLNKTTALIHLYASDPNSPYLLEPSLPVPSNLILTKTHCSGHCERCVPLFDWREFDVGCRSLGTGKYKTNYYDSSKYVSKAVHLFRNPFDNLVARMHLGIKRRQRKMKWKQSRLKYFQDTPGGVKAWCKHADRIFKGNMTDIMTRRGIPASLYENLPCHTDWFRYVEWHNRAVEVLHHLQIPVHLLYYENYTSSYDATVRDLFQFLEVVVDNSTTTTRNNLNEPFVAGKTYDNVYDDQTRYLAAKFVKAIATPRCWSYVRHYMEPWLHKGDIALLISYPNSGTSYTMANTRALTNKSTATNHGQEVAWTQRVPILGYDYKKRPVPSPFVSRPETMEIPHIALTKSHCGGFCFTCYPADDTYLFDRRCRTVSWNEESENGIFKSAVYDSDIVKKVVHLIRNPYDNIVSRMHHAINHQKKLLFSNKLHAKLTDPNRKKNLRVWCNYIDKKFTTSYVPESILNRNDSKKLLSIPCHADFIRYVYWHNQAFNMTKHMMGGDVSVYTLYYENYTTNYDDTVRELYHDFLKHEDIVLANAHPFDSSGKNYRDIMFDKQHATDIAYLIRALASDETWDYISHYFTNFTNDNNDGENKHSSMDATSSAARDISTTTTTTTTLSITNDDNGHIKNDNKNNNNGGGYPPQPHVAWLLSFPESGTALMMDSVQMLTNTTAATNYKPEVIKKEEIKKKQNGGSGTDSSPLAVPVRPDVLGSPYLLNPEKNVPFFVLTKTHCTGYCDSCSSHEFVYTVDSFEDGCRRSIGSNDDEPRENFYPVSLVRKAVHLLRDPFANLFARKNASVQRHQFMNNDTGAKEGLRAWCHYIDAEFEKAEKKLSFSLLDETTKSHFHSVPCASELYRYIVWHNSAIKMMQERLNVPVQYIHYEDFVSNYNQTPRDLIEFLGLDMIKTPTIQLRQQEQQSSPADLFDTSDAIAMAKFMHTFAAPKTWQHLRRYLTKWIPDDGISNRPLSRIAWLMSFPNSGTSYTMMNTLSLTNMSVATNYAEEAIIESNLTVALRPDLASSAIAGTTPSGPYILHPSMQTPSIVLTKTHCNPKHNIQKFEKGCRTSLTNNIKSDETMKLRYPSWLVEKVVHLFRSPFDNIVARMHLGIRKQRNKGSLTEKTLSKFTETKEGLHLWCEFLDDSFGDLTASWVPSNHRGLLKKIPCYSDLLHYMKWHENAIKVYDEQYRVPYHILYYEDYTDRYNETINKLYKFLDMPVVGKPMDFKTGKTYKHLFEDDEIRAMVQVVRASATPKCWELLSRYFVDDTSMSTDGQQPLIDLVDPPQNETSSSFTKLSRR